MKCSYMDIKVLSCFLKEGRDASIVSFDVPTLKECLDAQLQESANISVSTLRRCLVNMQTAGLIDEGYKKRQRRTYYITHKGKELLYEVNNDLQRSKQESKKENNL